MIFARLSVPLVAIAASFALAMAPAAHAAGAAPIYQSLQPRLATVKIPVYLPSWLPKFNPTVYPVLSITKHGQAYEVDLSYVKNSVGDATLASFLTANLDKISPGPHSRKVNLGHGITGYVGSFPGTAVDSLTVRWREGGIVYAMGRTGTEAQLIRAASSVVRVH